MITNKPFMSLEQQEQIADVLKRSIDIANTFGKATLVVKFYNGRPQLNIVDPLEDVPTKEYPVPFCRHCGHGSCVCKELP